MKTVIPATDFQHCLGFRGAHLFPSIDFDISPLSRKHSSGTTQRLSRASFTAKATYLDVGSRAMSHYGFSCM